MSRVRLLTVSSLLLLALVAVPAAFSAQAGKPRPIAVVQQLSPSSALQAKLRAAFVAAHHHRMPALTAGPIPGKVCYPLTGQPAGQKVQTVCSTFQIHAAFYRGKSYALAVFFSLRTFSLGQPERFVTGRHGVWIDLGDTKQPGVYPGIPCIVLSSWGYPCTH